MSDPFLESRHHVLADRVRAFGERHLRASAADDSDPAGRTRDLVTLLGRAGLLDVLVPAPRGSMDLRSVVTVREGLAWYSSLADAAFAVQGLGSWPVAWAGTEPQRDRWLPAVARGEVICAFAATEPEAGSDLAGVRTRAVREGPAWRLEGLKTCISNAGLAGLYTVLARTGDAPGPEGLSLFLVDGTAPGIATRPLTPMAARPLGEVRLEGTPAVLLGEEGRGFALARAALDAYRPGLGAAACGLAGRALEETLRWVRSRRQFGQLLCEMPAVRAVLADMHVDLAAARLLVRQAAWTRDQGAGRIEREGAAARVFATEAAQRVVDQAVQLHGAHGLMHGATVERLYREVRALRIEGGSNEVQRLVVAREILEESR